MGKKNINILMLAIVHKGIAIPIFWILLNKRGNSDTTERIALIKRFIRIFGQDKIESLVADREFIGKTWFEWLNQNKIPFSIRIKKNLKVLNKQGKSVQIKMLFHDLKQGQLVNYSRKIKLSGVGCYVSALGLATDELLLIASNDRDEKVFDRYATRWEIETLFSCLKGRGFDLEDTHLTKMKKVKKLLAVHAIAFCWENKVGEWQHERLKPITIKKHGRKEKSIFKLGLDTLIHAFKKAFLQQECSEINWLVKILSNKNQNIM